MTSSTRCPDISFESRLTEKGYRAVMLRVSLMRLRYILPIAAFFIFNALARGDSRTAYILGAMTLGTIAVIVLYANWASGSPSQRSVYDPVTYRTTDEGITFTSGDRAGLVAWDTIRRWEYVYDHFLLHVGAASYLLVPASALLGAVCEPEGASEASDGPQDAAVSSAEEGPALFESVLRTHVAHGPRRKF